MTWSGFFRAALNKVISDDITLIFACIGLQLLYASLLKLI